MHTHEYGRIFGSGPGRQSVMALRKHTYKRHEPNCPATTVSLRRLTANCRRMVPLASDENKRSLPNCSAALEKEALERACHQTTHPPHLPAKFLCLDRQLTAFERLSVRARRSVSRAIFFCSMISRLLEHLRPRWPSVTKSVFCRMYIAESFEGSQTCLFRDLSFLRAPLLRKREVSSVVSRATQNAFEFIKNLIIRALVQKSRDNS